MSQLIARPEANYLILAWNRKSGSHSREAFIESVVARLVEVGLEVQIVSDLEEIKTRAARERASGRLRGVICAGGDGTIRLMAHELGPEVPLAILPLGTENLLAKHLGIARDVDALIDSIVFDHRRSIDAAEANGNLYLIVLSCGFDAAVVATTHRRRAGHIRRWHYLPAVLKAIFGYAYPPLKIQVDGVELEPSPRWAFLFNVPRYAIGLPIAPEANPSDGQLDLCTFDRGGFWRGIFYFLLIVLRRQRRSPEARHFRCQKVSISASQPVAFQIDGDPGGELPVEVRVLPGHLSVFVPRRNEGR